MEEMTPTYSHYTDLAELFGYPDDAFADRVRSVHEFLNNNYPEAGTLLEPFLSFTKQASIVQMEELFLRTFDVQAITTLDIGYVLFGDDYKRGAVLVHLNNEHAKVGNPCYSELSDHLPNVLRLLPLLDNAEFREELVDRIVAPALRKIISEFSLETIEKKEKVYMRHHKTLIQSSTSDGTLYRHALIALFSVMKADFNLTMEKATETSSSFLKGIGTEIQLEAEDA